MTLSSALAVAGAGIIAALADNSPGSLDSGQSYAFFALIGAVVTAFITAASAVMVAKIGRSEGKEGQRRRAARRVDALERWILLNTPADPDLIETGDETPEEVARVPRRPRPAR